MAQEKAEATCSVLLASKVMDAVLDMLEALQESVDGLVMIFKGLKDDLASAEIPDRRSMAVWESVYALYSSARAMNTLCIRLIGGMGMGMGIGSKTS